MILYIFPTTAKEIKRKAWYEKWDFSVSIGLITNNKDKTFLLLN